MNPQESKAVIGPISPPLSAYTEQATYRFQDGDVELNAMFEADGKLVPHGVRFIHARAYRFTSEIYCTAWHIEDAYDTLVEVQNSDWIRALSAMHDSASHDWRIKHYLIYLDDSGAFEVAAEGFEWIEP